MSVCGQAQVVTKQDLTGTWNINDTPTIHKDFKVKFIFTDSSTMIVDINDERRIETYFLFIRKHDSSFLLFNRENDFSDPTLYPHHVSIQNDTLTIDRYYLPVRQENNVLPGDKIFFIKSHH
jgi:hypothetical protein